MVVQGHEIALVKHNEKDYISISDIVSALDGGRMVISNWLSRKDTLEYLTLWESLHNTDFKFTEIGEIVKDAGKNSFTMSPKKWVDATGAIGLVSKYGGGTLAHKDIAFDFCSWLSPSFRLYLHKEFDRLKDIESNSHNIEWNVKRVLTKANYQLHTSAVRDYRIPKENLPKEKEGIIYADEAEILNYAVWGFSSKSWREENQSLSLQGINLRDIASINELMVLSNLESINAILLTNGIDRSVRRSELRKIALSQLEALNKIDFTKSFKRLSDGSFAVPPHIDEKKNLNNFDTHLKGLLNVPPPKKEK